MFANMFSVGSSDELSKVSACTVSRSSTFMTMYASFSKMVNNIA